MSFQLKDLAEIIDQFDDLVYPVIYYKGKLSVFYKSSENNSCHQFGRTFTALR